MSQNLLLKIIGVFNFILDFIATRAYFSWGCSRFFHMLLSAGSLVLFTYFSFFFLLAPFVIGTLGLIFKK